MFLLVSVLALLSACNDGTVVPPGDEDGDIPTECNQGEAMIGLPGDSVDPFCASVCENELECPNEDDCCMAVEAGQDAQRYCFPALYCDMGPDACLKCSSDSVCRVFGYDRCDLDPESESNTCCIYDSATDGDEDGDKTDGDVVIDGDDDGDREPTSCDDFGPYLSYGPSSSDPTRGTVNCDFGAVPFGGEATCTVTVVNEGPEAEACIQYSIGQAIPEEFALAPASALDEGDSICIGRGKSLEIELEYLSLDSRVEDVASLEIFLAKQTDSGSILPCTEYIDLVTQLKGEVHAYTDPEIPAVVDFGDIRVGTEKVMPVVVGNRQIEPTDNRPMSVTQIRLDNNADQNFAIKGLATGEIPAGGLVVGQGQTANILVAAHPFSDGEAVNSLKFKTNDPLHPEFTIQLRANGVVPRICAEPFPVLFGDVALAESAYREVEICSCGGYELTVSDMAIEGGNSLSFSLDTGDINFPAILPPEGEGLPGSECVSVEVGCFPSERGSLQTSLEVTSDASGATLFQIPLACTGVGPTLCSFPASPIDFGAVQYDENFPAIVPPKDAQVWNCGPGTASVTDITISMGANTPEGTFTLANFQTHEPTDENPYPLEGGDDPNELLYQIQYNPPGYGQHRALIHVVANSNNYALDTFIEVKATATDCEENYWDLDPNIAGCEYYCVFQDALDEPDMDFIDSNCDGIDGMIDDAIFVATDGNDSNAGTYDAPKKSLATSIFAAAVQGKPHVYASVGTYTGRLNLSSGVSLFGGYNRNMKDATAPRGWKRGLDNTVMINGDNIGMNASLIGTPTRVQLISVQAYGSSQDDLSNYGIYSHRADSLILEYITISVGDGRNGQNGYTPGALGRSGERGENGQSGREDDGSWYCSGQGRPGTGLGGISPCGMRGGTGGYSCKTSSSGGCEGYPGGEGIGGTCGGHGTRGGSGTSGCNGEDGYPGSHGAGGLWAGVLRNGRWYPNPGLEGAQGGNGTGGGGGGGGGSVGGGLFNCDDWGGTGGGGGGGGCGGGGGAGGEGGGSSFGIFLYDSSPEMHNITITTGDGGDGGTGREGGRGGTSGAGGEGGMDYQGGMGGGYGGDGGGGGRGGNGGGGAGGSSFGMYIGGVSNPYYEEVSITLGENGYGGGAGGAGGQGGEDGRVIEIYPEPTR
jgi:hypothetical protein